MLLLSLSPRVFCSRGDTFPFSSPFSPDRSQREKRLFRPFTFPYSHPCSPLPTFPRLSHFPSISPEGMRQLSSLSMEYKPLPLFSSLSSYHHFSLTSPRNNVASQKFSLSHLLFLLLLSLVISLSKANFPLSSLSLMASSLQLSTAKGGK